MNKYKQIIPTKDFYLKKPDFAFINFLKCVRGYNNQKLINAGYELQVNKFKDYLN
jgi:hypothetical protein